MTKTKLGSRLTTADLTRWPCSLLQRLRIRSERVSSGTQFWGCRPDQELLRLQFICISHDVRRSRKTILVWLVCRLCGKTEFTLADAATATHIVKEKVLGSV
jgi:hypothetical protein